MDLLATVRKQGSRGGVNFSWDEVANSEYRQNYLGHSIKAPVGRWAKGRDLHWYAKADPTAANADETEEEKAARQRREEIQKIKEAEEDAMLRALGLPPKKRDATGANSVPVEGSKVPAREAEEKNETTQDSRGGDSRHKEAKEERKHRDSEHRHRKRHRSRDRSRDRDRDRERDRRRDRNRSESRTRDGRDDEGRTTHRRRRSRSPEPRRKHERRDDEARYRSRSRERDRDRDRDRAERSRHHDRRRSRSRSRSRTRHRGRDER
ncbi:hypothetical protein VTJ04DRAFT_8085 [Mycothermus thermophilus]|uniref:uncharacterized protein n=1 Tax=Humicola insolens TaxID=85995 RepID=UPI003744A5F5